MLIKITFITDNSLGAYEEALHVEVARTDLLMILDEVGLQPFHVWVYFNSIIDEWVSDRKNLYDQACKVAQGIDEENAIFRMVS